jgi:hypothetical protein
VLRHPHHRPGAGHLRIEIALLASLTNTGRFNNGCAMLNAASARSRLTNGARPQTVDRAGHSGPDVSAECRLD